MKKEFYIFLLMLGSFAIVSTVGAQESLRDRLAKKQHQEQGSATENELKVPSLTVRAQILNENQSHDLSNVTWKREIYRELDLTKGPNAALYYPEEPDKDKMNLFTMIFKLLEDNRLPIYRWNDGNDLFIDKMKENFGDVLTMLEIPFQQEGNRYVFDEFSIPNNEALIYYIKEIWYFDQSNSVIDVKTAAICPVVVRDEYWDSESNISSGASRKPLFWIPYESIRPYAARMPIMTSNLNNVMNKTIDDYFKLRLYNGEIFKIGNMQDKLMVETYKTPEALGQAREKVEKELKEFDESLWVINDSINNLQQSGSKVNKERKSKTPKVSKPKGSPSSSTYSARNRR